MISRINRTWIGLCLLIFIASSANAAQTNASDDQARPLNTVRIHYHRPAADYTDWGVHLWGPDLDLPFRVTWQRPMPQAGRDNFGVYFDIRVKASAEKFGFILHRKGKKDVQQDMFFNINLHGGEVWLLQGDAKIYVVKPEVTPQFVETAKLEPLDVMVEEGAGDTSSETLNLLRQLRSESVSESKRLSDRIETLQSELVAERLAREQAEKQTQEARTLFDESELRYQQQVEKSQGIERQLKRSEKRLQTTQNENQTLNDTLLQHKRGATKQFNYLPWLGIVAAMLLLAVASVVWLYRHREQSQLKLVQTEKENQALSAALRKEKDNHQQTEQRMTQLASFDELTGLPNRAIFNQTIQHAVSQAKRYKKQLALLFVDLDRFKLINDTLGHDAGDMVLKTVTERFRECIREGDTLARLGGDEFVLLVEDLMDPKYVAGVAQKLLSAAQAPFHIEGQEYHVSASIGISTFPSDGKSAGALLKNADVAMYRAKEQGKNNFQFFSEQMNIHSLQRLALESSLRHAVKRNELKLFYQPIVDTETMETIAVESLVRWQHPDMGLIGPLQFIPIAEETGLIEELGLWVLESACKQGREWHDIGRNIRVTVNMSARQLSSSTLLDDVKGILKRTGFSANFLTLEITESSMMNNPEESVLILQALKDLGASIAIDDFGTGYSSLGHLKRFPIDILKIDRSFVQDVPHDRDDSALTSAIIALGQNLNLKVVAEGIEHESQRVFLSEHACPLMQGYMICKPKSASDLESFFSRSSRNLTHSDKVLRFPS